MRMLRLLIGMAMTLWFTAGAATHAAAPLLGDGLQNLERDWLFRIDPHGESRKADWAAPDFDDSGWHTIPVPGDWGWKEKGIAGVVAQGGSGPVPDLAAYEGVAWYRLHCTIPKSWAGQDLELSLGYIDDRDETFFNGTRVGKTGPGFEHPSTVARCYTVPSKLVRPGEENVLAIRVRDMGGPGGIKSPLYLLSTDKAPGLSAFASEDAPLAERFANPPASSRILKILHNFPLTEMQQSQQIRMLAAQGFGGMATNVSFRGYLENKKAWKALERTVALAKEAGMSLWLYDEEGYPSGSAGGITLRDHPELEARGRYFAETTTKGDEVVLDLPPGDVIRVAAYPLKGKRIELEGAIDLTDRARDGKVVWTPPDGRWRVMAMTEDRLFDNTHASVAFSEKRPYINLLMPEATARFIEVTHEEYARHLGSDLGEWFDALFTDEPSLMSMFMRESPWLIIPWAPNFPGEFQQRRGYAIDPLLPALLTDAGPKTSRTRYDFWLTVAELVAENYFGQIQDWGREHNIPSGGHLLVEENLLAHVPCYGDFMRCARRLDAPSIDCLTSDPNQVPWFVARLVASAAELEGRTLTMSETSDFHQGYRMEGDTRPKRSVSEAEIRGTVNRLFVGGINTITSYYTFRDRTSADLQRLNDWVGRCSTMLRGGHQVADVAVVYPINSIWPYFVPSHNWVGEVQMEGHRIERTLKKISNALFKTAHDPTFVDAQALTEATVDAGVLRHGKLAWRAVVLPAADTLPIAAWENLERFWRTGGIVIALGVLPANSETEFPSARVQEIAKTVFGDEGIQANDAGGVGVFIPRRGEDRVPALLDALFQADVASTTPDAPIRATHRRIDGHEVYYLINDSNAAWEGNVTLRAKGPGERWDPATGEMTPIASPRDIPLSLRAYGGVLLRFAEGREPERVGGDAAAMVQEALANKN